MDDDIIISEEDIMEAINDVNTPYLILGYKSPVFILSLFTLIFLAIKIPFIGLPLAILFFGLGLFLRMKSKEGYSNYLVDKYREYNLPDTIMDDSVLNTLHSNDNRTTTNKTIL